MAEQSQIDDMRAAVRGDFERARARRETDPWRTAEPEREPEAIAEEVQPEAEPDRAAVVEEEPERKRGLLFWRR